VAEAALSEHRNSIRKDSYGVRRILRLLLDKFDEHAPDYAAVLCAALAQQPDHLEVPCCAEHIAHLRLDPDHFARNSRAPCLYIDRIGVL
jgi:hypothetical protein